MSIKVVSWPANVPQGLLNSAYNWFMSWCNEYHVDSSYYPYVIISDFDNGRWEVVFHDQEDGNGICVEVGNIYLDDNGKIIQATIDLL
jgi:hypothetical protein